MGEMKIEYVATCFMYDENPGKCVPVVRLADVDRLIAEEVKFAETLQAERRWMWSNAFDCSIHDERITRQLAVDSVYVQAQAFLASHTVQAWRERQKK